MTDRDELTALLRVPYQRPDYLDDDEIDYDADRWELPEAISLRYYDGGAEVDMPKLIDLLAEYLAARDARVKAEAWDEGARWAFEEITGRPEHRFQLAPGDNPHREGAEQ